MWSATGGCKLGGVANIISLNTTDHPALVQFLMHTPKGLFDFAAQKSGTSVTISDPVIKSAILAMKHPTTGKPFLKET
jgi:hypothetical protein